MNNTPKRPGISEANIEQAAEKVKATLSSEWDEQIYVEQIVEAYKRVGEHGNGYDMAKVIEDICLIEPDEILVTDLGSIFSVIRSLHKVDVLAWVEAENIQPPYPGGTLLKQGRIAGVYEFQPASYILERQRPAQGQRIIKFEDAELAEEVVS